MAERMGASLQVRSLSVLALSAVAPFASLVLVLPGLFHEAGARTLPAFGLASFAAICIAHAYARSSTGLRGGCGGEYDIVRSRLGALSGIVCLAWLLSLTILSASLIARTAAAMIGSEPGIQRPITAVLIIAAGAAASLNIRLSARLALVVIAAELALLSGLSVPGLPRLVANAGSGAPLAASEHGPGAGPPLSIVARLKAVDAVLATSDAPVSEIARAFGFSNPSRFRAAFRRQFGREPIERD